MGSIYPGKEVLVSFNLSNEEFLITNMEWPLMNSGLMVLIGSIALIAMHNYNNGFSRISNLGELGVKESWTKLFTIEPLFRVYHILGVGRKGDIFFSKHTKGALYEAEQTLFQFDLRTQTIKEIGFDGWLLCAQIVTYKESFLPIEGIGC